MLQLQTKEDSRVNDLLADPTACQYVQEKRFVNSASSIKVLLGAHINEFLI